MEESEGINPSEAAAGVERAATAERQPQASEPRQAADANQQAPAPAPVSASSQRKWLKPLIVAVVCVLVVGIVVGAYFVWSSS